MVASSTITTASTAREAHLAALALTERARASAFEDDAPSAITVARAAVALRKGGAGVEVVAQHLGCPAGGDPYAYLCGYFAAALADVLAEYDRAVVRR